MTCGQTADVRYEWRPCRRAIAVLVLASVATLTGCGSANLSYYTLTSAPGAPQGSGPAIVEVQVPTVAQYLNRDDIVLDNHDNQLHLARNAAWAEPLSGAIARNLTLDLVQRLPSSSIYLANTGLASKPDAVVDAVISQFAADGTGHAEITMMVSVHRADAPGANLRRLHVMAPMKDASVGALVASLSQALGQVADDVANDLRQRTTGIRG